MLIGAYTVSVLLMILLPLALAAWLRRAAPTPWLLFSAGCLTFVISQIGHIPFNNWLVDIGLLPDPAEEGFPLWRLALTLGLTAGLFEELARAAGYAVIQRLRPAWLRVQDAMMLGLGHGGFESMVIGGVLSAATISALLPVLGTNLAELGLTPDQLEALQLQLARYTGSPLSAGIPLLERLIAITAHVILSLMVWKAFAGGNLKRNWFYIPAAILYHTAFDFVAVWASHSLNENVVLGELALLVALLPGLVWGIWTVRQNRMPAPQAARTASQASQPMQVNGSLRDEVAVLWIAVRKELIYLWRTSRLLIISAVFLIFGLTSPMMAKFMPEIIGSFEEAAMFADLIPEPSTGDAMVQYIENISQFGFILAVLLGMGAVVGEKERGTAQMILSKPMSRWAFISSKFLAQFLMYLAGFILAGSGAYFYTVVLFGSLDFSSFVLLNGLLLLWLLTFVALSLLASTLASSTVAAGGIGLGLSVLLMIAGSLSRYGMLLPGGLMSWASLLGQSAAGSAPTFPGSNLAGAGDFSNGGAAASALVVVVLSLVLSLGIFEQQEL